MATFFPAQGSWTESDYLTLPSNRLVEFTDGYIEVLPMPTLLHQLIVKFLLSKLDAFINDQGLVAAAPLPVFLRPNIYREPDIVYLDSERAARTTKYPQGADLVMEVVSESPDDRDRDYRIKRQEYAESGIGEYWIVDPFSETISVLHLPANQSSYEEFGQFGAGQVAASKRLNGFRVVVNEVFDQPTKNAI